MSNECAVLYTFTIYMYFDFFGEYLTFDSS